MLEKVGKIIDGLDILLAVPAVAEVLSETLVREIEEGARRKVKDESFVN